MPEPDFIAIATLIAALAAVGGLIITGTMEAIRLHRNNKIKDVEFLLKFGEDLQTQLNTVPNLRTKIQFEYFAVNYLNMVGRVAYLQKIKKIPREISKYFDEDVAYAIKVMDFYGKHIAGEEFTKKTWEDIQEFFDKYKLKPNPEELPKPMQGDNFNDPKCWDEHDNWIANNNGNPLRE